MKDLELEKIIDMPENPRDFMRQLDKENCPYMKLYQYISADWRTPLSNILYDDLNSLGLPQDKTIDPSYVGITITLDKEFNKMVQFWCKKYHYGASYGMHKLNIGPRMLDMDDYEGKYNLDNKIYLFKGWLKDKEK